MSFLYKDVNVGPPLTRWRIWISDNNNDGVVDSATETNPSGDNIIEDFLFKDSPPTAVKPFLGNSATNYSIVGSTPPHHIRKLEFPVNRTSFYIKVQFANASQQIEASMRVLEGVDLARFF